MSVDYHELHQLRKITERLDSYVTELRAAPRNATEDTWRLAFKLTQIMEGQKP